MSAGRLERNFLLFFSSGRTRRAGPGLFYGINIYSPCGLGRWSKETAYVMFVNVAWGLVLACNVGGRHAIRGPQFFFFCRGVAVLKIALRSWRIEGKKDMLCSEVPSKR